MLAAALLVVAVAVGAFVIGQRSSGHSTASATRQVGSAVTPPTSVPRTTVIASTSTTSTTSPSTTTPVTTVAPTFASLYQSDVSGVVRIDASTCSGSGVGTGFLLSPTLVATAAHVVDGAVAIGLTAGIHTTEGTVIGIDDSTDVALIRSDSPLEGYVFHLDTSQPPVGTSVGVIGYAEGGPVSFSEGSISGLDRSMDVSGTYRSGLMQTDAAINPGNSGGPLLAINDTVVGLAESTDTTAQGISFAVPTATAGPELAAWQVNPSPPAVANCPSPLGSPGSGSVQNGSAAPDAAAIENTLQTYFSAIDSGDYATAYAQFDPTAQQAESEAQFAADEATTDDYDITLSSITPLTNGVDLADVTFTSLQRASEGPGGDQCDNWTLEYKMVDTSGAWLIDGATGQNGGPTHTSCS
jgi:serine protease Do